MDSLKTSIKPVLISHELANIGKLDITLHGVAALFYSQLVADGLIQYLKGLDHLGFIAKSHPGNHHKRWDYVCLQLYFLQKLKHSTFNTGLNRNTRLDNEKASNQEILQTFILFANIGHLEGTLSSEKGLFDFFGQNQPAKEQFLHRINEAPELRELAEKIFRTYDFYKMKYLVALNYILSRDTEPRVVSAIKLILKKYLHENDAQFEKLRTLYFKIRKVSFVYLDSFHCQTPIQVNLSKILVNIFSYDALFNPVDTDYDSILEACETVLSKELYLSPRACFTHALASKDFQRYLIDNSHGAKRIDPSNLVCSLLHCKNLYSTKYPPENAFNVYHFYLAKDSLKLFDFPINANFEQAVTHFHESESRLTQVLNSGLFKKGHLMSVQQDMRRTLIFFTVLLEKKVDDRDRLRILINLNRVFLEVLKIFELDLNSLKPLGDFAGLVIRNFQKDIIRRYFLYVLKYFFEKENRLNLFIKFQYRQIIQALNKSMSLSPIIETAYCSSKTQLLTDLERFLGKSLPADIDNNVRLVKHIVEAAVGSKRNTQYLYSIFPIEIEEMVYSAEDLDKSGNAENRRTITDIDAILIAFNKSHFELFLIEGKKYKKGFRTACTSDLQKIKGLSKYQDLISDPEMIETKQCKGGFLKIQG